MQEALAEAFAGGPAFDPGAFDPAALTPAGLVAVQVGFFTGVLFLGIACDAGKAWNRAPDVRSTPSRLAVSLMRDRHRAGWAFALRGTRGGMNVPQVCWQDREWACSTTRTAER